MIQYIVNYDRGRVETCSKEQHLFRRKIMKKLVSLILVCLMLAAVLTGCAPDPEDKGAIIPVSISKEMKAYDPVPMIYDAELVMNTGLLYEGLTVINDNGKVEKGLAKKWYTKIDEERGEYWLYFEIEDSTSWDD